MTTITTIAHALTTHTLAQIDAAAVVQAGLFDSAVLQEAFWPAVAETLLMTVVSTLLIVVIGTPLGLALVATARGGLAPNRVVHQVLGVIVNVGRSIPFIILMIAVLPLVRLIIGTGLGWQAAVGPLVVGAVPFFARLVETAIYGVEAGKVEAAHMMGATRWQIMFGVQVREALPALIQSVTVLMITIISYSAMAGAIGGGGLGQLAMNYGYYRSDYAVLWLAVAVIVIIVQIIQVMGDMVSRLVDHR